MEFKLVKIGSGLDDNGVLVILIFPLTTHTPHLIILIYFNVVIYVLNDPEFSSFIRSATLGCFLISSVKESD